MFQNKKYYFSEITFYFTVLLFSVVTHAQEIKICFPKKQIFISHYVLLEDDKNFKDFANNPIINYTKGIEKILNQVKEKFDFKITKDSTKCDLLLKSYIYFDNHNRLDLPIYKTYNIKYKLIDNYSKEVITEWIKNVDKKERFDIDSTLVEKREFSVFDSVLSGYLSPTTRVINPENMGIGNPCILIKSIENNIPVLEKKICYLQVIYENVFISKQLENVGYKINKLYYFDLILSRSQHTTSEPVIILESKITKKETNLLLTLNFIEVKKNIEKPFKRYEVYLDIYRILNNDFTEYITKLNKYSRNFLESYFNKN